jgi:phosphoenolpyruvate synthase/pyruvate phosphate dikinase
MFPENVVEGIVIPFGIFRQHMEQIMPGENKSYWQFLNEVFVEASRMQKTAIGKDAIDSYVLKKLEILREAILKMNFLPEFEKDFNTQFLQVLGKEPGKLPVFLRSDTNMEDLKDFTGAGLNLTLFNVSEKAKIMQGIKQVWASPYSERSFRWRQSYLLNPENVYPSILVIPTVNVDYSGVMITKGVSSGKTEDITIAFSRGAGGAVDGQAAESYSLKENGENQLFAPSREATYNELPVTGGSGKLPATFEKPILNEQNLLNIRELAKQLKQKMKETNSMQGPFDVEFGFLNNKLWLFQVRPFVENKNAAGSTYLESISPKIDESKIISLSEKL